MNFSPITKGFLVQSINAAEAEVQIVALLLEMEVAGIVESDYMDTWNVLDAARYDRCMKAGRVVP